MLPTKESVGKIIMTRAMVEFALWDLGADHTSSPKEANLRCPFHEDGAKPSLYINLDQKVGVYHCFAASCEVRGNFYEFIRKFTGWSEVRSLHYVVKLRKQVNVPSGVDAGFTPEPPSHAAAEKCDGWMEFCKPPYHPYFYERGLSDDTIARWQLGYDTHKDKLMLPWFDRNGGLLTIKLRSPDTKYYSFPKGANFKETLFGLNLVRQNGIVWIVEGEFDAMALDQMFRIAHFNNHYACALGSGTLHLTQLKALLKRTPTMLVEMCDNDSGGREASAIVRRIVGGSVTLKSARYPSDTVKDPGACTFEQLLTIASQIIKE